MTTPRRYDVIRGDTGILRMGQGTYAIWRTTTEPPVLLGFAVSDAPQGWIVWRYGESIGTLVRSLLSAADYLSTPPRPRGIVAP